MTRKSINIPLNQQEFDALYAVSQKEYRHPRDQARYILRSILLSEKTTEVNNGDAPTSYGQRVAISA